MANKKLIEVALPLERINECAVAERYAHSGHPFQLHMYWARRPLATTAAVIWSSLVDDPSSHPEKYPTEEDQKRERDRLFDILIDYINWKNVNNEAMLNKAKSEVLKTLKGDSFEFLDPFSGGGAIPLEAYRLGLVSHAHDLNPVSVLINKALIEIPPRFLSKKPVNPSSHIENGLKVYSGLEGLAEDVKYYGNMVESIAKQRIGYLYPKVTMPSLLGGDTAEIVAWIWARTIKCSNPLCACSFPLIKNLELSKAKGNEASINIEVINNEIEISIINSPPKTAGTISRTGAVCPCCGSTMGFPYIRNEAMAGRMHSRLMAIVADNNRKKVFLSPDVNQILAANVDRPKDYPECKLYGKSRVNVSLYGIDSTADLFNNRQLCSLVALSDIVKEIQSQIELDAVSAGFKNDHVGLASGGCGAQAYSEAIRVYLSFVIDKVADYNSAHCHWQVGGGKAANTFNRQAIPMAWDYVEANIFSNAYGSWNNKLNWTVDGIKQLPTGRQSYSIQFDAQNDCGLKDIVVSTDPPYYDNIAYADLSDFFYVWLRHNVGDIYPDLFNTINVPKKDELVATPYKFDGDSKKAKDFFENGMYSVCVQLHKCVSDDIPLTFYYAYKQSDTNENNSTSSSGWETMLSAIIKSGFTITGTWPMRTELINRSVGLGANALATSIVLVCRKRHEDAPQITKKNLVNIMRKELRPALKKLQDSNIAPVDMAQSAIGPGMGVYSRYSKVLEADGLEMTVRSALQLINEEIDLYFNEQVGDLDAASRFCVDLYTQYAYNDVKFGEAEILANAKATSIPMMASHGILYAKAGIVRLLERNELPEEIDSGESNIWLLTQQLTRAMEKGGVQECAKAVFSILSSTAEFAKDLAYRLYTIAEKKNWSQEAYAYNSLVVAWPDIQSAAAAMRQEQPEQLTFDI